MRTACWVSALLLVGGCAGLDSGDVSRAAVEVSAHTESGRTRMELRRDGAGLGAVTLERDRTVASDAEPAAVDVVGAVPGVAVAVADRYPSAPGALSFCQAGDEQFLRVLSYAGVTPAQTLSLKVASCRDNLELADPGLEWVAASSMVRVHWLTGPNGAPEVRAFQISADGTTRAVANR